MTPDDQGQTKAFDTVYRHRFCGCTRAVVHGQPQAPLHRLLVGLEACHVERREVRDGSEGPDDLRAECPHQLTAADVAAWAILPKASDMMLDALVSDRAFRCNSRVLQLAGLLPSDLGGPASIGLPLAATRQRIDDVLGIHLRGDADAGGCVHGAVVNSWHVVDALGQALVADVADLSGRPDRIPGAEAAETLVDWLLSATYSEASDIEVSSMNWQVLKFAYGSCALLALGAERRQLAFWAYELSKTRREFKVLGHAAVEAFRNEMVYRGQLEVLLGEGFTSFLNERPSNERKMIAADMGKTLLSHLLVEGTT